MRIDEIKLLFEYNYWADHRILDTSAKVGNDEFAAATALGVSFKSLRGTLVHILDAERNWRMRLQKSTHPPLTPIEADDAELTEVQLPTLAAIKALWSEEEAALKAYLGSLTDEQINGIVRYPLPSGLVRERILWHAFIHLVNHGSQHRSEAAAVLTMYDRSPGELDFNVFLNEHFHLPS